MAELARKLADLIGERRESSRNILSELRGRIAEANGSFRPILKGIDMDLLDVAKRRVEELQEQLLPSGLYSDEQTPKMFLHSQQVLELIRELRGKLKYLQVEELR